MFASQVEGFLTGALYLAQGILIEGEGSVQLT